MTAREPSAVEVIAEALLDHGLSHESRRWECDCGTVGEYGVGASLDHQADATLAALKAAGFVVATRDEIRAEAWDEGYACGQVDHTTEAENPYREVQP